MQSTSKKLFQVVGKISIDDVAAANGSRSWLGALDTAKPAIEEKYPQAKTAVIQGSKAHHSTKDPSDSKEVITIGLHSEGGTRLGSFNLHEDGTFKDWPSRAGRK